MVIFPNHNHLSFKEKNKVTTFFIDEPFETWTNFYYLDIQIMILMVIAIYTIDFVFCQLKNMGGSQKNSPVDFYLTIWKYVNNELRTDRSLLICLRLTQEGEWNETAVAKRYRLISIPYFSARLEKS